MIDVLHRRTVHDNEHDEQTRQELNMILYIAWYGYQGKMYKVHTYTRRNNVSQVKCKIVFSFTI